MPISLDFKNNHMKPQQANHETKQVHPYAWVVLAVSFIASIAAPLAQFKVPPIMPVLIDEYGLNLASAGFLMSIFSVAGFFLALPSGLVLQKLGLKITGLAATGTLILGSIIGATAGSQSILLVSRIIEGVGMGLIAVVAPASIAMWFPPEKRGAPMGIWSTWVPVGSLLTYLIAPTLTNLFGWRSVWWFTAAFAALAFILVLFFLKPPPFYKPLDTNNYPIKSPTHPLKALANRDIWLLGLVFGLTNFCNIALVTYYPTFLVEVRQFTIASAATLSSIQMIVILFSSPLAGALSDKIGSRKFLLTYPFLIYIILYLFPFALPSPAIPFWLVFMGMMGGLIPTASFSAAPEIMNDPRLAGLGMAVVITGQNLGMFSGPIIFSIFQINFGWKTAGLLLIPFLLLGFSMGRLIKVR